MDKKSHNSETTYSRKDYNDADRTVVDNIIYVDWDGPKFVLNTGMLVQPTFSPIIQ